MGRLLGQARLSHGCVTEFNPPATYRRAPRVSSVNYAGLISGGRRFDSFRAHCNFHRDAAVPLFPLIRGTSRFNSLSVDHATMRDSHSGSAPARHVGSGEFNSLITHNMPGWRNGSRTTSRPWRDIALMEVQVLSQALCTMHEWRNGRRTSPRRWRPHKAWRFNSSLVH